MSSRRECMLKFHRKDVWSWLIRRSQLQSGAGTGEEAYTSMLDCFRKIVRNEGYDPRLFVISGY